MFLSHRAVLISKLRPRSLCIKAEDIDKIKIKDNTYKN